MRITCVAVCLFLIAACSSTAAFAQPRSPVDFRRDVAPIFETHCLQCHSGTSAKGGLPLTTRALAIRGGESGAAFVPGSALKSSLLDAVSGDKPEMPKNGNPLSKKQIGILRTWIATGAEWPKNAVLRDRRREWWSFQPLKSPAVPHVGHDWSRTPIDAFILRKLHENKLRPSPQADRRVLIRRLTFDLHGLPPTPAEVADFIDDRSPNAYEQLVDRLLASPRYGERWGRHWLDVVHYGDTHGFDKDKRRPNAWPYRDYVIRAFNADKPYGQFVREQLAGDVLRPDHPDGVVATGFIVAGPWDFVGHVELREGTLDKKITRNLDRDDMVMNAMSTFASLTVHCARCHDHKFDPILQREYYQLQAVFAGVERAVRPYEINATVAKTRHDLKQRLKLLSQAQSELASQITNHVGAEWPRLNARIAELKRAPRRGKRRPEYGYHSGIAKRQNTTKWVQIDLGKPATLKRIVLIACDDNFANIGAGFGFPLRYKMEISNDARFQTGVTIVEDRTQSDVKNPGVAPQSISVSGKQARYIRVTATKLAPRQNDFIFALAELKAITPDGNNVAIKAIVTSLDSIEAPVRWRRSNLTDGFYSGGTTTDVAEEFARLTKRRGKLWNSNVPAELKTKHAGMSSQIATTNSALAALPKARMVYASASQFKRQGNFTPSPNGKPRPIHILNRGSVKSPGVSVSAGTVGVIREIPNVFSLKNPNDEGSRRLALANWLTNRRNPLAWRSIVNRVWHYHFGRGLVDSPNDFGRMGSQPTHPELLDWLAVNFRDNGQSLKSLHRMILTSAVYQQQSLSNVSRETIDGGNRFLWRMNRRRLEAEALRDTVLDVSGRLDSRMYGAGYDLFRFESDHSPRYLYDKNNVDDPRAMRRTVYRFIVRSVPDPFLESLDCADPSINVPKRNTTITAIQALALLNNRFMVRQAEHLAERLQQDHKTIEAQITAGYLTALARRPQPNELTLLVAYTRKHGLRNFCRLLFNTNEFLFVD